MHCLIVTRYSAIASARRCAAVLTAALALVAAGCQPAVDATNESTQAEHDPDDVPITEADVDMPRDFVAAVARLNEYSDRIKEAITGGTPTKAHRPLDEMDIVIGRLMPIARDHGVPRSDWEEVNLARRALRAQFDTVHAGIDNNETPNLAAALPGIDAALERLSAVASKLSSQSHQSNSESAENTAVEAKP